jgi:hypothetical protein
MNEAIWKNGDRRVRGRWSYNWAADRFYVVLDSKDRITGMKREMCIAGDTPEWGGWRLVRERAPEVDA